jgi:hypothetical protein
MTQHSIHTVVYLITSVVVVFLLPGALVTLGWGFDGAILPTLERVLGKSSAYFLYPPGIFVDTLIAHEEEVSVKYPTAHT